MIDRATVSVPSPGRSAALHSVGWLVAANVVGVWLALCLLWPQVGDLLAPLTFGRWAPLHLDWQLYGWCSLPLVGALLAWFLDSRKRCALLHANLAFSTWSLALALGGITWLGGASSGKLFLDWHGWARPLLPVAMQFLWTVLAIHTYWCWPTLRPLERGLRVGILGLLLAVPSILYWSTGRGVYQSVNPDSGGATGAAVLGSTLGIVTIYLFVPVFLGLKPQRRVTPYIWALAAAWLVFAGMNRGNVSHHVIGQIVALGVLLFWIPLLPLYWRCYEWSRSAKCWLRGAAVWWALLVVNGWLTFLPGFSERWKFTHELVGHSHLAMAGLVTSVNAAIITTLAGRPGPTWVMWTWQAGCALFILSMFVLGWNEAALAGDLFRSESWTQWLMGVRLVGGVAMTWASAGWLRDLLRQ